MNLDGRILEMEREALKLREALSEAVTTMDAVANLVEAMGQPVRARSIRMCADEWKALL